MLALVKFTEDQSDDDDERPPRGDDDNNPDPHNWTGFVIVWLLIGSFISLMLTAERMWGNPSLTLVMTYGIVFAVLFLVTAASS